MTPSVVDDSAVHMIRDNNSKSLPHAVQPCAKVQGIGVIGANHIGFATSIGSPYEMGLADTTCVSVDSVLPSARQAHSGKIPGTGRVFDAIADPDQACDGSADRPSVGLRWERNLAILWECRWREDGHRPADAGL